MRIMVLCKIGTFTNAVINALRNQFDEIEVIAEDGVSPVTFFKRRIKKLGVITVLGQVIFLSIVPRHLRNKSKKRINAILKKNNLDTSESYLGNIVIHRVNSVNSDACMEKIKNYRPDIIVVNGTGIISERVLDSTTAPFINMHLGITPKYRGVQGGYWAMANNDKEHCGVTVHLIDKGIDTGNIISQAVITTNSDDNYITYPYLQIGEGIQLELTFLKQFRKTKEIITQKNNLPSKIWSHPTIGQYLRNRKYSK